MGGHDRCCVAGCDNDKRYPAKIVKKSHAEKLVFHAFPKDEEMKRVWIEQVSGGLNTFQWGKQVRICSNHFEDGKPTTRHNYPTKFLRKRDFGDRSPKKRAQPTRREFFVEPPNKGPKLLDGSFLQDKVTEINLNIGLQFSYLGSETNVRLFTGLPSSEAFELLFSYLQPKAQHMQYWKGEKLTLETPPENRIPGVEYSERKGPSRSLSLEQELLLVLMRLRMALLVEDLAFRFDVTASQVSSIFTTWIKLMARELSVLIVWPTRVQVKNTLPDCFRKMYPKCRVLIDCSEVYTETPTALDVAATLWSEYKHHHTIKFLVAITPTGAVSWVSPVYGGRASDIHIVRDSGFLNLIERFDLVMADRGFKIKEELLTVSANLAIPPSAAASMQMRAKDVKETSQIANVRIHVERAIRRIKVFRILKQEMPMSVLPLADDILVACAALCNLQGPLVV